MRPRPHRITRKTKKTAVQLLLGLVLFVAAQFVYDASTLRLPAADGSVSLYSTHLQDDLRRTYVAAIDAAQKSVLLEVYTLSDQSIINALKTKAEQGIPVQVLVDSKASPLAKKLLGPQVKTTRRSPSGLMHLKILVIDEAQVWIGSANMTYDSLRTHGNIVLAMTNPALAATIRKRADETPASGAAPRTPVITFTQNAQTGELWFLPSPEQGLQRLITAIQEAKSQVRIAMFTWTHPLLTEAVIDAHRRGLHVEVVIDSNQGQGAGAETVHKLKKAKVKTSLSNGEGLLHYKMLIIDDHTLVCGSANWTRSAFKHNDDCMLFLFPLNPAQNQSLDQLWSRVIREVR